MKSFRWKQEVSGTSRLGLKGELDAFGIGGIKGRRCGFTNACFSSGVKPTEEISAMDREIPQKKDKAIGKPKLDPLDWRMTAETDGIHVAV